MLHFLPVDSLSAALVRCLLHLTVSGFPGFWSSWNKLSLCPLNGRHCLQHRTITFITHLIICLFFSTLSFMAVFNTI